MHPQRRQRLFIVIGIVVAASLAVGLILYAIRESANLFYPPAKIVAGEAPVGRHIRAGGMVRKGSVQREEGSLKVRFVITDYHADVPVVYEGILPDLFAEDSGIVASGKLDDQGVFIADEVLAKHDENYMPPEVADSLKKEPANSSAPLVEPKP